MLYFPFPVLLSGFLVHSDREYLKKNLSPTLPREMLQKIVNLIYQPLVYNADGFEVLELQNLYLSYVLQLPNFFTNSQVPDELVFVLVNVDI